VRPFPIDVMVHAVVAMNSVHAEKPFVSLLGDTFAADPSGFARMLGDILLDGLEVDPGADSGRTTAWQVLWPPT
jgi:hypothetical protein